jgi:hypothetical protein
MDVLALQTVGCGRLCAACGVDEADAKEAGPYEPAQSRGQVSTQPSAAQPRRAYLQHREAVDKPLVRRAPCFRMSTGDDEDIQLQRASASLLADLEQLLPRLLRKRKQNSIPIKLMYTACALVLFSGSS